jgi:hypothetical protein
LSLEEFVESPQLHPANTERHSASPYPLESLLDMVR